MNTIIFSKTKTNFFNGKVENNMKNKQCIIPKHKKWRHIIR